MGNGCEYEHYSWVQTLKDATATFQMPKGTKGRDCDVQLTAKSLRVGVKGQPPIVDGPLFETIKVPLMIGWRVWATPRVQLLSC